ncbi:MAG: MFS transporter [Pseudomonadota bacterium]
MTRLAVPALAAYAAPALPLAALFLPLHVHLGPFWTAARGVDLAALGTVLIAVRLLDAVTDPIMGWLSDRRAFGLGRAGWLAVGVPVILLAAFALLRPPETAGLVWFAGFMGLMTLGWTMATVPYLALGAEVTRGYAERARVTVWRESAGLIGTIATLVLIDRLGLSAVALAVALLLPPAAVWLALRTRPAGAAAQKRPALGLPAMFRGILRDRLFLRLLLAFLINGAANGLPPALFLFYVGSIIARPDAAGLLLLAYFLTAVLGSTLWSRGARHLSKHRLWCVAMLGACAAFLPAAFLAPGDLWLFAAISCVTGVFLGADLALPPAIQADVVDHGAAQLGLAGTASFFAIWAVAQKAALALSGGLAYLALDAAGFRAGGANDATALGALAWLYAGAPVLLKLAAVGIMWRFPLDRAAYAALQRQLASAGAKRA